jgi:hypothetical protein
MKKEEVKPSQLICHAQKPNKKVAAPRVGAEAAVSTMTRSNNSSKAVVMMMMKE